MSNRKAFIVVGHRQWGKSTTVKKWQNGKKQWLEIKRNGKTLKAFVRRMSNDDISTSYLKFIEQLDPANKPLLIITLCPEFEKPERNTVTILQKLRRKNYRLFFFVLKHRYNHSEQVIPNDQISTLRQFGKVKVFEKEVTSGEGARAFKNFVVTHL